MTFGSSGTGTGTGMDNSIPEVLGSIYLLNIIVLRNVEEAEKIGGLVSLTVIQFPF